MRLAAWRGWAVISLHEYAESLPVAELARDLQRHLPRGSFFFPAVSRGQLDPTNPLASYVFLVANHSDRWLRAVERSRYVERLLCAPNTRRVSRLTDADLRRMVAPARPRLAVGQAVRITVGDWAGLEARVVGLQGPQVTVRVRLWSREEEFSLRRTEVTPT